MPSRVARFAAAMNSRLIRAIPAASSAAGGVSCSSCGIADGATGVHPPCVTGISWPPSHGTCDEPLRPAWASWIATGIGGACLRAIARRSPSAFSASVVVEAQAAVGDPSGRRHRRCLDREHACARLQQLSPVHQVPVGRPAVDRRVLTHRRDDDAVGEGKLTELVRREQGRGHRDVRKVCKTARVADFGCLTPPTSPAGAKGNERPTCPLVLRW